MKYVNAKAEIILFDDQDVVTWSKATCQNRSHKDGVECRIGDSTASCLIDGIGAYNVGAQLF